MESKTNTNNISVNEVVAKQRMVSKELGKNITKDHERIYNEIQKNIGETKICSFGHIKGSKTGVKHEGRSVVPIRDFELKGVTINDQDIIEIKMAMDYKDFVKYAPNVAEQQD